MERYQKYVTAQAMKKNQMLVVAGFQNVNFRIFGVFEMLGLPEAEKLPIRSVG